jgi:predicted DNA-binding transcriptional regulator AlpA
MTKQKKEQRAMSEAVLTFADLQNRKHWPYSRVTTWRMIREGRFPKPFRVEGGVRNLWLESTVDKFLADRANDRPGGR